MLTFIDDYIKKCVEGKITNPRTGKPISKMTWKGYKTCQMRITAFHNYRRNINFNDIDLDFYNDYTYFLRFDIYKFVEKPKGMVGIGLAENSIGTDIKNIKMFMSQANRKGLTTNT